MTEQDKGLLQRFGAEIGIVIVALGALGYMVVSPKEQMEKLSLRIEQSITAQQARDASQDDRIANLKSDTETAIRAVGDDVRSLVLARCLSSPVDPAIYSQLKCRERLGR